MGGACSRRMHHRQYGGSSSSSSSSGSGAAVTGGLGLEGAIAVSFQQAQQQEGVQQTELIDDDGDLDSSMSLPRHLPRHHTALSVASSRLFRSWSTGRGGVAEGGTGGGGRGPGVSEVVVGGGVEGGGVGGPAVTTAAVVSRGGVRGSGVGYGFSGGSVHMVQTGSGHSGGHTAAGGSSCGVLQPVCQSHGASCHVLKDDTLLDLCVRSMCGQLATASEAKSRDMLAALPKDLCQRVFEACVHARVLTLPLLRSFSAATVEDALLPQYPGLSDKWLLALRQQTETLLAVDVADCHSVTDVGLLQLLHANRLERLVIDMCVQISDDALIVLQDCADLRTLSCRGCHKLTALGLKNISKLPGIEVLNLERCPQVHGGFGQLARLARLRVLNLGWCNLVDNSDLEDLRESLSRLEELHLSRTKVDDHGVRLLSENAPCLKKLSLAGCPITNECFPAIAKLSGLEELNLEWCLEVSDAALPHLLGMKGLRTLVLAYTAVGSSSSSNGSRASDNGNNGAGNVGMGAAAVAAAAAAALGEMRSLEKLSLDSCPISDSILVGLPRLSALTSLDLSDTAVGDDSMQRIATLRRLHSLNVSFTGVTDDGVRHLSSLTSLERLSVDSRAITDRALSHLARLSELKSLDVFGAKISDSGLAVVAASLKQLTSLEVCGGGVSDVGVRALAALRSLRSLNLSQNAKVTDAGVAALSGLTALEALSVSGCTRVTVAGLTNLRALARLRSLALHNCRVPKCALQRLRSSPACLWPKDLVVSGLQGN